MAQNDHFVDQLRKILQTQLEGKPVERAFLFGSRAVGREDRYSDTDLILVADSQRPFPERFKDFRELLFKIPPPVDLLVYTPSEFERLLQEENGFLSGAVREGLVVYEKPPTRSQALAGAGRE